MELSHQPKVECFALQNEISTRQPILHASLEPLKLSPGFRTTAKPPPQGKPKLKHLPTSAELSWRRKVLTGKRNSKFIEARKLYKEGTILSHEMSRRHYEEVKQISTTIGFHSDKFLRQRSSKLLTQGAVSHFNTQAEAMKVLKNRTDQALSELPKECHGTFLYLMQDKLFASEVAAGGTWYCVSSLHFGCP